MAPSLDLTADELSSVGASLVAFADGSYISRPPSPRPLISRTPKTISKQAMDLIAEIERYAIAYVLLKDYVVLIP